MSIVSRMVAKRHITSPYLATDSPRLTQHIGAFSQLAGTNWGSRSLLRVLYEHHTASHRQTNEQRADKRPRQASAKQKAGWPLAGQGSGGWLAPSLRRWTEISDSTFAKMLIFYVNLDIWMFIKYVQDIVDICSFANEIRNILNKHPNIQINIENQHLSKCRVRYFGLLWRVTDKTQGNNGVCGIPGLKLGNPEGYHHGFRGVCHTPVTGQGKPGWALLLLDNSFVD